MVFYPYKNGRIDQKMEKQARRNVVRQDMLNGMTNQNNLAARHGVGQATIHHDIKAILIQMKEEDEERAMAQRSIAIGRLEDVVREATVAFEKSKQNKEEVRIEYKKRICNDCDGTGMEDGNAISEKWCETCEGLGTTVQEHITKKVTGTAGDSSFLKEKREAVKQQAYILGLIQKGDRHIHEHAGDTTVINVENISPDKILEAMQVLENLASEVKNNLPNSIIEVKAIEEET